MGVDRSGNDGHYTQLFKALGFVRRRGARERRRRPRVRAAARESRPHLETVLP